MRMGLDVRDKHGSGREKTAGRGDARRPCCPTMSSKTTDDDDPEKRTDTTDTLARDIESLRDTAENVRADLLALADGLEDGSATLEDVTKTVRALSLAYPFIEDAAGEADVIDADTPGFRGLNQNRIAMAHAASAIKLDDDNEGVIAPRPEQEWSAAISASTSAAEYAEIARDASGADE